MLGRSLRGPGVTRADVVAATTAVTASLEVIDSRIADWKIRLADTIADMASSARIVDRTPERRLGDVDLRAEHVVLERNGEVVAEGVGAAVLGDPLEAVAWAANTLGPLGVSLEPGHIVMPGAMHASVPVTAGDTIVARFDRLGLGRRHVRIGERTLTKEVNGRTPVAVVGSGNIGTDLVMKLLSFAQPRARRAHRHRPGLGRPAPRPRSGASRRPHEGVDWLLANAERLGVRIVYEATSARIHAANAAALRTSAG